ncbi:MAG: DUF5996 family protein [Gemmatimonadaceae bacterium]
MSATNTQVWPSLPLRDWKSTCDTLHMWTQIVGKTRLKLAPMENHWWQVALYVTPRGLTTSAIPNSNSTFAVEFDFIDHKLIVATSGGATRSIALKPRSVAEFYGEYLETLKALGIEVRLWGMPVEVMDAIPFAEDRVHASYDSEYANRFWRILVQADRVLKRFRGGFLGKSSPVHFFWGGFDMAATRFSGRQAPPHAGGAPNVGDWVMREAYSHEVISAGFWPGSGAVLEPAFYAYAYPEPAGLPEAAVRPVGAYYNRDMGLFALPYETVRLATSPDEVLMDFLQSTYEAAADLARWDRSSLERLTPAEPRIVSRESGVGSRESGVGNR